MKMPQDLAKELQWRLSHYMPIDCPHPYDIFLDCGAEGRGSNEQWQLAVDLIYRLLISDLVSLLPTSMLGVAGDELFFEKTLHFCRVLAQIDPEGSELYEIHSPEYGLPWPGFDLCLTEKTRQLIRKHGLFWEGAGDAPLVEGFIEDIEATFSGCGVPWSDQPIIPIPFGNN